MGFKLVQCPNPECERVRRFGIWGPLTQVQKDALRVCDVTIDLKLCDICNPPH